MPSNTEVGGNVSRHFFRRTARIAARRYNHYDPKHLYRVERAERGPFRYFVVKLRRP